MFSAVQCIVYSSFYFQILSKRSNFSNNLDWLFKVTSTRLQINSLPWLSVAEILKSYNPCNWCVENVYRYMLCICTSKERTHNITIAYRVLHVSYETYWWGNRWEGSGHCETSLSFTDGTPYRAICTEVNAEASVNEWETSSPTHLDYNCTTSYHIGCKQEVKHL